MLQIDSLNSADVSGGLRLSTQAGWNQVEPDWARLIALWPDACLAGRFEQQLVATSTLARFEPRWAWVGMVLVDTAYRGQGFGAAIFDAILSKATQLGIDSLGLDATDAGKPIYLKRGFVDVVGIDRRVLRAERRHVGGPACDLLEPADWPGVLELDRTTLGIDRSVLLERLRNESIVRITRAGDKITGFGFRRPGRTADQIGPVVATSANDARSLIQSLAELKVDEPPKNVLLDSIRGGPLQNWLDSMHFDVVRKLTRMIRGGKASAVHHRHLYTAAGLELG